MSLFCLTFKVSGGSQYGRKFLDRPLRLAVFFHVVVVSLQIVHWSKHVLALAYLTYCLPDVCRQVGASLSEADDR